MSFADLLPFILALLAFGALAGLIAGLFGVGGGIITVPLLDTVFRMNGVAPDIAIHMAVGTSLLTIVPTALASWRTHARHNAVDSAILKSWGIAIVIGSILGSLIATRLPGHILTLIFGVFVIGIAAWMGLGPAHLYESRSLPKSHTQGVVAFVIGLISALVGVGGGSLSVPMLVLYGTPIHRAIGTASALGLLISLPGALIFMLSHGAVATGAPPGSLGNVNLLAFAILAPATMLTAPTGAKLAHRLPAQRLRRIFAAFLALIAVKMIVGSF